MNNLAGYIVNVCEKYPVGGPAHLEFPPPFCCLKDGPSNPLPPPGVFLSVSISGPLDHSREASLIILVILTSLAQLSKFAMFFPHPTPSYT